MSRQAGILSCVAAFVLVCVLALTLSTRAPFAGLNGIQDDLAEQAIDVVVATAPDSVVTVSGQDVEVVLPERVDSAFSAEVLEAELAAIDGVRNVTLLGDPAIGPATEPVPQPQATVVPTVEPTVAPEPTPEPEPTAEPTVSADPDQAAEPTSEPDPTPEPTATTEPTPEPTATLEPTATAEPTPEPTPEPKSLSEIVADIDVAGVSFETGTALLTAQDIAVLDDAADQLLGQQGGPVDVRAHTDNVGDPDVNLLLSQQRANAVRNYLIERGVDPSLLTATGLGSSEPIASNSTAEGRAANRRIELVVEGN